MYFSISIISVYLLARPTRDRMNLVYDLPKTAPRATRQTRTKVNVFENCCI
jgi:hypothetical protein